MSKKHWVTDSTLPSNRINLHSRSPEHILTMRDSVREREVQAMEERAQRLLRVRASARPNRGYNREN